MRVVTQGVMASVGITLRLASTAGRLVAMLLLYRCPRPVTHRSFGKIDKSAPMTFGLISVFRKGDQSKSHESTIRQGLLNVFSTLSGNLEIAREVTGGLSRPPSRKSSIGFG